MELEVPNVVDVTLDGVVLKVPYDEVTMLARQMLVSLPDLKAGLDDGTTTTTHLDLLDVAGHLIAHERRHHLENLGEWPTKGGKNVSNH